MHFYSKVEDLTKRFVAVRSVNGSAGGEKAAADFLEGELRRMPYFRAHPEQIIRQPLEGDPLGRSNIFAYIHGTKYESAQTMLWHGHIDTVGTEDYGRLEPYATDCDRLLEELLKGSLPDDVRRDLESGDWLPGRGACDMKSGDAVFLVLLEYLSEHLHLFGGNILVSFTPVEENQHTGILQGLHVLQQLQDEQGFSYRLAINNDYICPLYAGDPHRYLYAGVVGKLLPCFYVRGLETHVGQCFEGFDAATVIAEITRELNGNTDFCDHYRGEYAMPPSVLRMRDLKPAYNVQTPKEAWAYFNLSVHSESVPSILRQLLAVGDRAMREVARRTDENRKAFARMNRMPDAAPPARHPHVLTYASLHQAAGKQIGADALQQRERQWLEELDAAHAEPREYALELVRRLTSCLDTQEPVLVLFFAGPYCPHNTLHEEIPEENAILETLRELLPTFSTFAGAPFELRQFFPSLSDSSYLKIDDDEVSLRALQKNFPGLEHLYPLPLDAIRALNIPALDFGCYGKDAHKWSERVYKPYSFEILPHILLAAVEKFFG